MTNYSNQNNLLGWLSFIIATTVYTLTLEPTASFWDCGEFIAAAYKMQVVHQPGAPLFLIIMNLFTNLAMGDVSMIAFWANFCSAVCSGLTILFLFWTISALSRKILVGINGEPTNTQSIAIFGSAMIGALAYTFSDTFWFSAVEAEVYAMSSLCTAIVFWAILKWDRVADEPGANRWLVFIAYVMGLSIGVHLLNLLAIPAIVFVYYFRKYEVSRIGVIKAAAIGILILGFVQYGVIPGVVSIAAKFDLLFVNTFGLPFGSGVLVWALLVIGGIIAGLLYTVKHQKVIANTALVCLTFILIGYGSYAMIVLRAKADPNLNNSHPDNVFALLSYLNREQYGDTPLFHGQNYKAKVVDEKVEGNVYRKGAKKYEIAGVKRKPIYDPKESTLFPRMHSNQADHVNFYQSWANIPAGKSPTFADNLGFFFTYQVGHMYFRYFMWNFAGRQNDVQGHGSSVEGNWISGIKPIDALRLGKQNELPKSITQNKANNQFYLLPLILGLIGAIYHFKRKPTDAWIVSLLIFFTGVAIIVYLNQSPFQPRERDYAFAGSFYAFAIWIGIGVLAIYEWLNKKINAKQAAIAATAISLIVPTLMAVEGWDDHDRSNRYITRDIAINYLESCEPNAILFTMGDNDTYPLWYVQEVEGIRTDVRVVNLSLLGTDWYNLRQQKMMNDSEPVPTSYTQDKYVAGVRDYVPFFDRQLAGSVELKDVMDFIGSDSRAAQLQTQGGEFVNYLPTKNLKLTVDKEKVLANGTVKQTDADKIVSELNWTFPKNGLFKNDLMFYNIIAANNWERPIYLAITVPNSAYLGLEKYFRNDGFAYRLVPYQSGEMEPGTEGSVDLDILYDNMINKFTWGNINGANGKVYIDPETNRMINVIRNQFYQLAKAAADAGKMDTVAIVLDKMRAEIPNTQNSINFTIRKFQMAELYYKANKLERGNDMITETADYIVDELNYFNSIGVQRQRMFMEDIQLGFSILQELVRITERYEQKELNEKLNAQLKVVQAKFGVQ